METLWLDPAGPKIDSETAATDLIGDAFGAEAELVVIPVERLTEDFFTLRTRLAGEIAQKFVNYRLRLAIVGDISAYEARSEALRDFVRESNRGRHLWFVPTAEALSERLNG
ncbi:DUF4180 domain-containing protein [Hamadaea tsunoensis]|uniref:DUF4180 domain-containing protein n=1 Tax=Hamadaea tsunoensis TaxID=53368 RepID=UPI0004855153|nr:DUF4180 domain-containing protein [Hamadaea tsunoensis]